MSVHANLSKHITKTAQRLEEEVESRPWLGWPGILAWRWVGRANKLDINFFGHKLAASANAIYWCVVQRLLLRSHSDVVGTDSKSKPRPRTPSSPGDGSPRWRASQRLVPQVHEHPVVRDLRRRLRFSDDVVLR